MPPREGKKCGVRGGERDGGRRGEYRNTYNLATVSRWIMMIYYNIDKTREGKGDAIVLCGSFKEAVS